MPVRFLRWLPLVSVMYERSQFWNEVQHVWRWKSHWESSFSSWFEIWVDKTCGCSDCSWNKPLSRLAFRKKNQNDPNFWTTFGVLSLRQNLRMFSFHRIAAVEIKPLSMVCITQSAQNVLAHLILRTCFSSRVKLGKVPILCINAMYSAHFAEHWYFVRCA